jgi:hypothetical protein
MQLKIKAEQSVKWSNLIWSIVILFSLTLYFIKITWNGPHLPGLFGFFLVSWLVCLPAALIVLLLRLFRFVNREAFIYIFLGVSSFYLGICGLYFGVGNVTRDAIWVFLYTITTAISIFMLVDAFVLEIPGIRKSKINAQ